MPTESSSNQDSQSNSSLKFEKHKPTSIYNTAAPHTTHTHKTLELPLSNVKANVGKRLPLFSNLRNRLQKKGISIDISQGYQLFENDSLFTKETHRIIDELPLHNEKMFEKSNQDSKMAMNALEIKEIKVRDDLALLVREIGEVFTISEKFVKHQEWNLFSIEPNR